MEAGPDGSGGAAGALSDSGVRDAEGRPPGIYVNPGTGSDTNDGTFTRPFKTIGKATVFATALPAGQTIHLQAGTYDSTTQSYFDLIFPPGTNLVADAPGGVTIESPVSGHFYFAAGGSIRDVRFDGGEVTAQGSGSLSLTGVHFTNSQAPFAAGGSVKVTVDASGSEPFVTNFFGGSDCVTLTASAELTFTGGSFTNLTFTQGSIFAIGGTSKLTLDGTIFDSLSLRPVKIAESASATLKNVRIGHLSNLGPSGADSAAILFDIYGSLPEHTPSLLLQNSTISDNVAYGILASYQADGSPNVTITIEGSHLDRNLDGLFTFGQTATPARGKIQITDSTFNDNKGLAAGVGSGISVQNMPLTITGGEVSRNGGFGISFLGPTSDASLKVRGTKVDANGGSGIYFRGSVSSTLDLGRTGDPGGIVFIGVPTAQSAVNFETAIQGFAVGNTWMPNVQGASSTGAYASPTTITGPEQGQNAFVVSGGSLVVAE